MRNSLSFFATDGVRGNLSGLPDLRFAADDPIRNELLIEDQKSIRKAVKALPCGQFVGRPASFCCVGILRAIAVAGGTTALALIAPIDEGESDLRELNFVATLGE